ncbi:hypothetical protein ACPB8Q_01345 [Methanocaldococcus indicus]|uniref:hypothetical protein n=1 Tax=Methanocaldococcus indicus TaxID=213231 RepID=UPI003C6D5084
MKKLFVGLGLLGVIFFCIVGVSANFNETNLNNICCLCMNNTCPCDNCNCGGLNHGYCHCIYINNTYPCDNCTYEGLNHCCCHCKCYAYHHCCCYSR